MGSYDTAQLCLNGHLITESASFIQHRQEFCDKCGSKTIMECQNCNSKIRGFYNVPGVISFGNGTYERPNNCYNCGQAYPWTEEIIEVADELISAAYDVPETEQQKAKASLLDLLNETPRLQLAQIQFKNFIKKAGPELSNALRDITVDILSETVKKSIWG